MKIYVVSEATWIDDELIGGAIAKCAFVEKQKAKAYFDGWAIRNNGGHYPHGGPDNVRALDNNGIWTYLTLEEVELVE